MTKTELSPQQREARALYEEWRANPRGRKHFYIGGYAGTGKTTLAKEIINSMTPYERSQVMVMAPTGKAADVLRKKGIENAVTIHSTIYTPQTNHAGKIATLRGLLRDNQFANAMEKRRCEMELEELLKKGPSFAAKNAEMMWKMFIVDEFSMVGQRLYNDLVSFGVPILAFGDPGQLPPVKDAKPTFGPDYTLTQIHRQAEGNPIIKLAHMARNGEPIRLGDYGMGCRKIAKDDYTSDLLTSHDQIITYTNECRRKVNWRTRTLLGHSGIYPKAGEKVVCRKNNYYLKLWNGAIYTCLKDSVIKPHGVAISLHNGEEPIDAIQIYQVPFMEYHQKIGVNQRLHRDERDGLEDFDFGYCITGHLSQGSEWDSVFVIDETDTMRSEDEACQWLYTAITRASKRITLMRR